MDFRYHLIDVVLEFLYAFLFDCRDEYARYFSFTYPYILNFLKTQMPVSFRLKRKFVIFFLLVGVCLVEYHLYRLFAG